MFPLNPDQTRAQQQQYRPIAVTPDAFELVEDGIILVQSAEFTA